MLTSADAGTAGVQAVAELGADAVKVWLLDPPDAEWPEIEVRFNAVAREAAARQLPLIVHATTLREARAAVRAGAHMLVHSVESALVDSAFVADVVARGTIYVPTLVVGRNWTNAYFAGASGQPPTLSDPLGCVDAATKARIAEADSLQTFYDDPIRVMLSKGRADAGLARGDSVMAENLRRLHAAGATIAVGTDAGNPLTLHGASIHDELAAFERVGISPESLIVMATRNGARAMRRDNFGTLNAGKSADLLVLGEDPRAAAAAFRSLEGVMLKGLWVREP
jgi:imidazolonepropionase-like amidohydrolase